MELNIIPFILCDIKKPRTHMYTQIVAAFGNHNISEEMILKISKISELYHLSDLKLFYCNCSSIRILENFPLEIEMSFNTGYFLILHSFKLPNRINKFYI